MPQWNVKLVVLYYSIILELAGGQHTETHTADSLELSLVFLFFSGTPPSAIV